MVQLLLLFATQTGATRVLEGELEDEGDDVGDVSIGEVQFGPEQVLPPIVLDPKHLMMSGVSMIAPSPDWFAGLYDLKPMSEDDGTWLKAFKVELYPMDAGTEQGSGYSTNNDPESQTMDIMEFTRDSNNRIFLSPDGTEVRYVALLDCVEVEGDNGGDDGSMGGILGLLASLTSLIFFC